jgi:hypothetical protein
MGTDNAARQLHLLAHEHLTPEQGDTTGRRAPGTRASAPLDLGVVDYMAAAVREVVDYAQADIQAARTASPEAFIPGRPAADSGVYGYWRNVPITDEVRELRREEVIHRQGLEHAVRAGYLNEIRREPCPDCGCWGLFWRPEVERAACVNRYCTNAAGMSQSWSLEQLAHAHATRKMALGACATS